MSKPDGGAAFPVGSWNGMTLRDYMAAQALQTLISTAHLDNSTGAGIFRGYADLSYKLADAMLNARKQ